MLYGSRDLPKATRHYERALQLYKSHLGLDSIKALDSMYDLAFAYQGAGRTEAWTLFEEILSARALNNPNHVDTLDILRLLTKHYTKEGRLDEVLQLFELGFNIRKENPGPVMVDAITQTDGFGTLGGRQGFRLGFHMSWAVDGVEQDFQRRRAKLSRDDPATLASENSVAQAYLATGRVNEAQPLFAELLELQRAKLGPDAPDTLTSTVNLALAYMTRGDQSQAEPLLRELLARIRIPFDPKQPGRDGVLALLGLSLLKQAKWAQVEPIFCERLATRLKNNLNDWHTSETRNLLGSSLLGQKKYADAKPLLLSGYEGMKAHEAKIPAPAKNWLTEARARIVTLYEAWG